MYVCIYIDTFQSVNVDIGFKIQRFKGSKGSRGQGPRGSGGSEGVGVKESRDSNCSERVTV